MFHHRKIYRRQIYDDLGVNHTLQTYFVKTSVINEVIGANAADFYTWDVHYVLDKVIQKSGGTISFYDVTGELSPSHSSFNPVTPVVFQTSELGSGAGTLSITPDFSKTLQKWGTTSSTESVLATSPSADPSSINAADTRNYQYSTGLSIYDSLGISHTLNLYFRKTADNTWSVYKQIPDIDSAAERMGRLIFDSRGVLIKATDNSGYTDPQDNTLMNIFSISFGNGAGRQNIELNFADTTQFDSQSITNSLNQNGYTMGSLSKVEADESGNIVASYSNDQSQIMGQVVLARFAKTQDLKRVGDNNWIATEESGQAIVGKPGYGSLGQLVVGALEGSNVELTKELVNMITAQRSFQANTQVINTSGTLYQSILNIRT